MRPLTDTETKTLFEKLANYTGSSLKTLLTATTPSSAHPSAPPDTFTFVIQKDRVYYVRTALANLATSIARDSLLSLGTCLGKFTKTGKFRLHITALDILAPHARYKVWVKANGEMPFLYGGHVVKAHVGRWSEDCPEHQGVVVLSMGDTPLGFGVTARSAGEARRVEPTGVVVFRQADCGEFLREEESLFVG
ncbi:60S ribosome subunit biogenesis protein nip7 [Salinomyces thailandicus]|uniref:60S ribosome subunit biogenesis protein NIP7 n=1 Tax=Salinomyces thailandicus TaxID=706561 RepID=A0A4U0U6C3_9PEZI|nr:60S ribosome subunit biogenesis protein nip7 [Salinomyces thailandica]